MSKSNYLENKILDHVLGGPDYVRPATVYAALFMGGANWLSDTDVLTEQSGSGYSRLAVTNNATNFPAASAGQKSNGTAFIWPVVTGSQWQVCAMAVFDAATGGNQLFWAYVADWRSPVVIPVGQQASFAAGSLIFIED